MAMLWNTIFHMNLNTYLSWFFHISCWEFQQARSLNQKQTLTLFIRVQKRTKSIIFASVLGAILPGCACATMPMAEGLARKGAKLGTTAAFIMTSPLLAPQTIILTYALLGPQFTIARVIFSLMGGIGIGFIVQQPEQKIFNSFSSS